jgi:hypothetical protein
VQLPDDESRRTPNCRRRHAADLPLRRRPPVRLRRRRRAGIRNLAASGQKGRAGCALEHRNWRMPLARRRGSVSQPEPFVPNSVEPLIKSGFWRRGPQASFPIIHSPIWPKVHKKDGPVSSPGIPLQVGTFRRSDWLDHPVGIFDRRILSCWDVEYCPDVSSAHAGPNSKHRVEINSNGSQLRL